jgi:hypothetical protein
VRAFGQKRARTFLHVTGRVRPSASRGYWAYLLAVPAVGAGGIFRAPNGGAAFFMRIWRNFFIYTIDFFDDLYYHKKYK